MSIEEQMLAAIVPDRSLREKVGNAASDLMAIVRQAASARSMDLEVRLVGSVAKDTYLGDPDIDVFVLFPEDTPRERLEKVGLSIGHEVLADGTESYAEHPYIHGTFRGFQVDLVPCYRLADALRIKSAVDRTPFHTDYVLSNLRPEQHDQVRLLKQFMKGVGVYGANAKVCGFSGYLAELLVLRYGDFKGVVSAATGWTAGTVLSLSGETDGRFRTPLVFIDPVDGNRNVASALSMDSFATFVFASARYNEENDPKFFFPAPSVSLDLEKIRSTLERLGTKVVLVRTPRPDLSDDNLYPQIQRTLEGLSGLLEQYEFKVIDRSYTVKDDVLLLIMLENDRLSDCTLHIGPPVWVSNSDKFLERWREEGADLPFIKDGKWVVMAARECPRASDLLRRHYKEAALGNAFRKFEEIEVFDHDATIKPEFQEVLSKMMDKRFAWER